MTSTVSRVALIIFVVALALFFVTPLLWFIFTPFNPNASLTVQIPRNPSLENFREVLSNEVAMRGLLQNSTIIGVGTMVGTSLIAALAA
jgi:multiple sugar transport system permease protein